MSFFSHQEGEDQLFSKETRYIFPGTYDEASLLLDVLYGYKDQKHLFSQHTFSPFLIDKIKD